MAAKKSAVAKRSVLEMPMHRERARMHRKNRLVAAKRKNSEYICHKSKRSSTCVVIVVLALCSLVASIPCLVSYLPYIPAHDLSFHLYRIEAIAQGLAAGEFPVRMHSAQIGSYGYPAGICYGDIFLYPFAVLRLLNISLSNCYRALVIAVNIFTAIVSYVCFSRMMRSRFVGVSAAVLWTLAPYRLVCLFVRAAVGEYLALCFFPVVAYGVWLIFAKDVHGRQGWLVLALGMSGIVLSHVLSTLIVVLTLVPVSIVGLVCVGRGRRLTCVRSFGLAVVACMAFCLFFILPFVNYYLGADLAISAISSEASVMQAVVSAIEPAQLFSFFPEMSGVSAFRSVGVAGEMPLSVGWAIIVVALGALVFMLLPFGRKYLSLRVRVWAIALVVTGACLLLAATWVFPWQLGFGDGAVAWLVAKLSMIQFPWRLIGIGSFMLLVAAGLVSSALVSCTCDAHDTCAMGFVVVRFAGSNDAQEVPLPPLAVYAVLAAACAFAFAEGAYAATSFLHEASVFSVDAVVAGEGGVAASVMNGEYLPAITDKEILDENLTNGPLVEGGVQVSGYSRQGSTRVVHVDTSGTSGTVTLPMLWYAEYKLDLEGSGSLSGIKLLAGENGVATLWVPAGTSADVTIYFDAPLSWKIADTVSFAAWVCLAAWFAIRVLCRRFA